MNIILKIEVKGELGQKGQKLRKRQETPQPLGKNEEEKSQKNR